MRRALAWLGIACAAVPAAAQPLTPSEAAGRTLYHEGRGASGRPVTAEIGMARSPMAGPVVACVNCHGADGLGRPEGGVTPSAIAWSELAKPYGHVHDSGRRHGAFDAASFARAITRGLDPAGNVLDPAMPRFALDRDDLRDLVAYLGRLGNDPDPGLTDGAIRVGTVLPAAGPLAPAARAMREAIEAVLSEANESGGIYGRQLQLVARSHAQEAGAAAGVARELIDRERVFALLSPFALGAEDALAALAEERRVPVVGPFTVRGPEAAPGRFTFYLFAGVAEQAQVLVDFGLEHQALATEPLAIVHPATAAAAAQAAQARCARKGCASASPIAYAEGAFDASAAVAMARAAQAGAVLFLGPAADLERFAAEAARSGWSPALLAPGVLGARAAARLPEPFAGRLLLAYPPAPTQRSGEGRDDFDRFAARHRLAGDGHALPAFSGYLAASLLVDALRRAGRAVGREKLVTALEGTTDYRAGLAHPLRYGPQRRIGALGGHVVAAGPAGLRPASGWIALD